MTDKIQKLEKLKELHSKVVKRLDSIDDILLKNPFQDGPIDLRIRLHTLVSGISLDISLLETQIAADKADRVSGRYPYNVLNTEEKKEIATKLYADGIEHPLTKIVTNDSLIYVDHDNSLGISDEALIEAKNITFLCTCRPCKKKFYEIRDIRIKKEREK